MKTTFTCPFCGSNDVTYNIDYNEYHCHSCEMLYSDYQVKIEKLRHKMSAILMHTSENKPKPVNVTIMEDSNNTCGLSCNELPLVTSVFQDGEGIIWFNIYGCKEPIEFDEFDLEDIETVYGGLIDTEKI